MPLDLTADERAQLAADVAEELDTGRYGDRFVLSRRQLLSIAGGSAGVAGLTALGVDPATAQSAAGQVGTSSEPVDTFAFDLDVANALQSNLDAGGNAISNVGSLSANEFTHDKASSVQAALDADQSIATADGWTRVNAVVEDGVHDIRGDWDDTNHQFTAPLDGVYHISATVRFTGQNDSDGLGIRIQSGSGIPAEIFQNDSGGQNESLTVSKTLALSAGTVLNLQVNTFDADATLVSGNRLTYITIHSLSFGGDFSFF